MIFNFNMTQKLIKKNTEFVFLFLLIIITILSTTFYNNRIKITNENYKEVINNIYFKKSIDHIFDTLSPRYKSIDHKISHGETFHKILKKYLINAKYLIIFYFSL